MVAKLRELAAANEDLGFWAIRKSHPLVFQKALGAFGSYPEARRAAGVGPAPLTRWSREKIIEELQKAKRGGAELAPSRLMRTHASLYDAAYEHFDSYGEALAAAGFNYDEIRLSREWSKETIAQKLRELDEKDVDLRSSALARVDGGLWRAACNHFGSYEVAMKRAGLDYPPKKPLAGWVKSGVLQMLRQLHEDGEDLRYSSMKKKRSSLFFAARYYFDSYVGAVGRAGLNYDAIVREQLHGRRKWRRQAAEN